MKNDEVEIRLKLTLIVTIGMTWAVCFGVYIFT